MLPTLLRIFGFLLFFYVLIKSNCYKLFEVYLENYKGFNLRLPQFQNLHHINILKGLLNI